MLRAVLLVLLSLIGVYTLYCAYLYLVQRRILFPRHLLPPVADHPALGPGVERLWIGAPDGPVEAWFFTPRAGPEQPAPTLLVAHGNAERIDDWLPDAEALRRLGWAVMLVEYPGYGRSPGAPSQPAITTAFVAAFDTLVARTDVDPNAVVFLGRSLGSGVVCALATVRTPRAMVLISAFTSARALASTFGAPGFLVRDPFDNAAVLSSYQGPVLVVHGRYDEVIPYAHGRTLAHRTPRAELLSLDCGHNDCDVMRLWGEVDEFLSRHEISVMRSAADKAPQRDGHP